MDIIRHLNTKLGLAHYLNGSVIRSAIQILSVLHQVLIKSNIGNYKKARATFYIQVTDKIILHIQWGSEYQTSLVLKWWKRGWVPNSPLFQCHLNISQVDHLNTRQMDAILFSYVLVQYICIQIRTIQLLFFTEKFSPLLGFEPGTFLVPSRYATN